MTDQATAETCRYPGCQDPPEPVSGPGRHPQYCADPGHNAMTASCERKKLAALTSSYVPGLAEDAWSVLEQEHIRDPAYDKTAESSSPSARRS